jgi:hypothetical protein
MVTGYDSKVETSRGTCAVIRIWTEPRLDLAIPTNFPSIFDELHGKWVTFVDAEPSMTSEPKIFMIDVIVMSIH